MAENVGLGFLAASIVVGEADGAGDVGRRTEAGKGRRKHKMLRRSSRKGSRLAD